MGRALAWCLVGLCIGAAVHADDGSEGKSSLKIEDPGQKVNSIPNSEEIDELITNKNLRAYSGSTSRWSIASIFNYNGGTIQTPLNEDRPNIAEQSATTTKADLDGAISTKYNINVKNAIMAGVGLRWIAPLASSGPKDYDGTRFDVQNPFIQYQYIYNWGVQSVLQAQLMQWTQADSTALGYDKQYNLDQENMYEIGKSGLSLGASIWAEYTSFSKRGGSLGDPSSANYIADLRTVQADMQFGFTPELEYELTEKLNLRTMLSLWVFEHYRNLGANTFFHDKVFQSIGLGYSLTRDVFIYPNIQFLPDKISSNLTNVGVQATVNLF